MVKFEFLEQPINDILYAFSNYARIPIISDNTVTGNTSFRYYGQGFEDAFEAFLLANRLCVDKRESPWVVTRVLVVPGETGNIDLEALDATPSQILDKISRGTGVAIIFDILPATRVSLHLSTVTPVLAVELVMKSFSEYTVTTGVNYIQVRKEAVSPYSSVTVNPGKLELWENDGRYTLSAAQARVGEVLERLFASARKEFVSFLRQDQIVERLEFSEKNFEETIRLIMEQGSGEGREINGIWYFFPLQQAEIIQELKNTGKVWRDYTLRYVSLNELVPLLQNRFSGLQTIALTGSTQFMAFVNDETDEALRAYLEEVDAPPWSTVIQLKYIRVEDLFKALPPSVRRDELVDAGNGHTLFYTGTEERRALFLEDLALIDQPATRIRYDLFIIQVQETSGLEWNIQAEERELRPGDQTLVTGLLGNLLNLNFDVVTVFGYQFAARLNTALSENSASVFADTTLYGLSGQDIKFQNTNTYRYRDYNGLVRQPGWLPHKSRKTLRVLLFSAEVVRKLKFPNNSNVDSETGKPTYSGVTREITSGLVLDINGWVSGDGMITITITASVSKRGADVSSQVGNPPPTSEKMLTTQVRARSRETIVLSGLRQNDSTIVEQGVPLLSKIPLLGWLFKGKNSSDENTQMIIYLVPHIDLAEDTQSSPGEVTASLYKRFVEPYLKKGDELQSKYQ